MGLTASWASPLAGALCLACVNAADLQWEDDRRLLRELDRRSSDWHAEAEGSTDGFGFTLCLLPLAIATLSSPFVPLGN